MVLRPQDVLVLLKLAVKAGAPWTYPELADELGMSASEVHGAVKRASVAGLMNPDGRQPNRRALLELCEHGLRYVFPAVRSAITRGMPTAHAAQPLSDMFKVRGEIGAVVWPDPEGAARGEGISPLYESAPKAARRDAQLYEVLALVDALRGGRARERELASAELRKRLL